MTNSKTPPSLEEGSVNSWAFDWLDLLLLLLSGYGTVLFTHWLGWQPSNPRLLVIAIAPLVWGALHTRRRWFPQQRKQVQKKFSWWGLLATLFLTCGFLFASFGGWLLWESQKEPQPDSVSDSELRARAVQMEETRALLGMLQALDEATPVEAAEDENTNLGGAVQLGNVDDLFAALQDEFAPQPEELDAQLAKFRVEAEELSQTEAREDRKHQRSQGWLLSGIGLGLILLGGLLDSRRPLVPAPFPE